MNLSLFNQDQVDVHLQERRLRMTERDPQSGSSAVRGFRSNALPPPSPDDISRALGIQSLTIDWLAGDGSDRCYYRLRSPELRSSLVLMQLSGADAKALREDGYDWITIANILAANGITVPKVVVSMPAHAALIIEDYGDMMLETAVYDLVTQGDAPAVKDAYLKAFAILTRFLKIRPDPRACWCKRSFDTARFEWELNFFFDKYYIPVIDASHGAAMKNRAQDEIVSLSSALASQSNYFVHRDFHSRNIMVNGRNVAVIDFQDARLGPPSYDLVSLCFDSYVPFNSDFRSGLMAAALETMHAELDHATYTMISGAWRPVLLQRQLKAIGSFGFLTLDKKRGDYLKYVGPAIKAMLGAGVLDSRWPLLSGLIVDQIAKHTGATNGKEEFPST